MSYITGSVIPTTTVTKKAALTSPLLYIKENGLVRSAEIFYTENPKDKLAVGVFVALSRISTGSVRIANSTDKIFGVISGINFEFNTHDENGENVYMTDKYNRIYLDHIITPKTQLEKIETGEFYTDYEYEDILSEETGEIESIEKEIKVPITKEVEVYTGEIDDYYYTAMNPKYDSKKQVERKYTKKCIIALNDDGTCKIGEYCRSTSNGIATLSNEKTDFLVLDRIDDFIVKAEYLQEGLING